MKKMTKLERARYGLRKIRAIARHSKKCEFDILTTIHGMCGVLLKETK